MNNRKNCLMFVPAAFIFVIAGVLILPAPGLAHCKGNHTGDHPHCVSEPPPACEDIFPGFAYGLRGGRKAPENIGLASSDGCRTEIVYEGEKSSVMHMTADRSKGILVWTEDPGDANQHIVRRLDFEVDEFGNLDYGPAVTILPLAGDEPLAGEYRGYGVWDIWGTANHDALYLAVVRSETGTREAMIYDLTTLTSVNASPEVRTIHIGFDDWQPGGWQDADPAGLTDCNFVDHPQFVPTCYAQPGMLFNASGTRLYLDSGLGRDLQGYDTEYWGLMRIATDDMAAGVPLADWDLAGPELVFANDLNNGGPSDGLPRPGVDPYVLPSPEILFARGEALNADLCVVSYSPYAGGNATPPTPQSTIRQDCVVDGYVLPLDMVWESPNSGLLRRSDSQGRKAVVSVYRTYVRGPLAGTEEKLLEGDITATDAGL